MVELIEEHCKYRKPSKNEYAFYCEFYQRDIPFSTCEGCEERREI